MELRSQSNLQTPEPQSTTSAELQEAIRRRAEEIYVLSGKISGRDRENWAQAEKDVLREYKEIPSRRAAVVVRVHEVRYVGQYDVASSAGYSPGEFEQGTDISLRFDGKRMFLKRANGEELETTIVCALYD